MGIVAIDLDLGHQGEGHTVVDAAELGYLGIGTGLLMSELVAREADDHQALVLILLIQSLQAIILRSESAFGSGINYHENLALVLSEIHLYPFVVKGLEIINLCHIFPRVNSELLDKPVLETDLLDKVELSLAPEHVFLLVEGIGLENVVSLEIIGKRCDHLHEDRHLLV